MHPGDAEVFVRDRGRGFDPDNVAEDRLGVRNSIVARMERHGGSAEVRSTPGQGTEVRLRMPVTEHDTQSEESAGLSMLTQDVLKPRDPSHPPIKSARDLLRSIEGLAFALRGKGLRRRIGEG